MCNVNACVRQRVVKAYSRCKIINIIPICIGTMCVCVRVCVRVCVYVCVFVA